MKSGVYQIRNIVDGNLYIGSSKNISQRRTRHYANLRGDKHHSRFLQRAWNKYGEECFSFEVLQYCEADRTTLVAIEQSYIDSRKPAYNMSKTAANPSFSECSDETRLKLSVAGKGKKRSPETIARMRVAQKGRTLSAEHRDKIRATKTGKKNPHKGYDPTPHTRKLLSESMIRVWEERKAQQNK